MRNKGRVLSRDVIIEAVWGHTVEVKPNTVDAFVSSLRPKVDEPNDVALLQTGQGIGFSLREPQP